MKIGRYKYISCQIEKNIRKPRNKIEYFSWYGNRNYSSMNTLRSILICVKFKENGKIGRVDSEEFDHKHNTRFFYIRHNRFYRVSCIVNVKFCMFGCVYGRKNN